MPADRFGLSEPLPRYGLVQSFVGDRWMEDDSRYTCEIGHRPTGSAMTLSVIVVRRATGRPLSGGARAAISPHRARKTAANPLVLPVWRPGDGATHTVIDRVANDESAWRARAMKVDDRRVTGYEREYRGRWVAYHLTPELIVIVAAPVALRPDVIELKPLAAGEFRLGDFA